MGVRGVVPEEAVHVGGARQVGQHDRVVGSTVGVRALREELGDPDHIGRGLGRGTGCRVTGRVAHVGLDEGQGEGGDRQPRDSVAPRGQGSAPAVFGRASVSEEHGTPVLRKWGSFDQFSDHCRERSLAERKSVT